MEERLHLLEIGQRVRDEIAAFVVPKPHPDQLGTPLPKAWFLEQVDEMRDALVEPYSAVIDGEGRFPGGVPGPIPRPVVVVAEDDDIFLVYDPDPEGDFALIFKTAEGFAVSPLRGDAVSCFLSR